MTLNRPKGLNALNMNMVRQMMPMVRQWASDDAVKVVVLEGAGSKAFCAGGDVVAVAHSTKGDKELSRAFFKEEYILDYHLSQLKKPYVALIDGITMGGKLPTPAPATYTRHRWSWALHQCTFSSCH